MTKFLKINRFEFVFGQFEIVSNFACLPCTSTVQGLREAPPCGTKAGISCFGFRGHCSSARVVLGRAIL